MNNNSFDISSPIFITGRGGSGTRLLSMLLRGSQMFLGSRLNKQGDSMEWVKLNREMLLNGISIENNTFSAEWQEKLKNMAQSFLFNVPDNKYTNWGAKLPEFMFFLPELLCVFPKAKIIHLTRHPVSLSLRRSHVTSRLGNTVGDIVLPKSYQSLGMDIDQHLQKEYLNNAVSWYYQLNKVISYADKYLNNQNYHLIRFEDIIENHQKVLDDIHTFIGQPKQNAVGLQINKKRANITPENSKEASQVWEICSELAQKIGYNKINHE